MLLQILQVYQPFSSYSQKIYDIPAVLLAFCMMLKVRFLSFFYSVLCSFCIWRTKEIRANGSRDQSKMEKRDWLDVICHRPHCWICPFKPKIQRWNQYGGKASLLLLQLNEACVWSIFNESSCALLDNGDESEKRSPYEHSSLTKTRRTAPCKGNMSFFLILRSWLSQKGSFIRQCWHVFRSLAKRIAWRTSKTKMSSTTRQRMMMILIKLDKMINGGFQRQKFHQTGCPKLQENGCSFRRILWTKCSKQLWLSMLRSYLKWRFLKIILSLSLRYDETRKGTHPHVLEFLFPSSESLLSILLPQNGRASLGDSIYKSITDEHFDPNSLLSTLDLSSEHKILDLKNKIEASVVIWKRKMNSKDSKSSWSSAVSMEKRELFEDRAETILLILKHRFPGIPQSGLDISKIQFNRVKNSIFLRSYNIFYMLRSNP